MQLEKMKIIKNVKYLIDSIKTFLMFSSVSTSLYKLILALCIEPVKFLYIYYRNLHFFHQVYFCNNLATLTYKRKHNIL